MNATVPTRVIHIVGALLVLAVAVAGMLMIALPLFVQAQATTQSASDAAAGNLAYRDQVTALAAEEDRRGEIETELAALREAIPASADLDDVFERIAAAAGETGVTLVSASAGEPEAWTARPADVTAESAQATADGAGSTGETDAAASGPETPAPAADASRQQVGLTIVVESEDPLRAARFLDAVTAGPRLIAVVQTALSDSGGAAQLTVSATTFVAPGD